MWRVADPASDADADAAAGAETPATDFSKDAFFGALGEFVSYRTVSSRPEFSEDCHQGATFLAGLFKKMGARVELLNTHGPHNPVVLATFSGIKQPPAERKRILFYGHYDVVAADTRRTTSSWTTDPFEMKGDSGFLYGRGVSDNKGPILAALFAVTDLMQAKDLQNDIVFLIEGEEESGSAGFQDAVRRNKHLIGPADYVLLANSYWLDDEVPCLTYGLRGVLHATVCVDSAFPNRHAGVDGSYLNDEPLSDLTSVLAQLKGPRNRVMINGFYDRILPITPDEEARFDEIVALLARKAERAAVLAGSEAAAAAQSDDVLHADLKARWREPNLTIHRYKVSGPDGGLVSSHASANISLRLVPGQEVDEVIASLVSFLEERFSALGSRNKFSVHIDNRAEPWLGDPASPLFQTLRAAVVRAWTPVFAEQDRANAAAAPDACPKRAACAAAAERKPNWPLFIREGGSIPAIRFLEKEFSAPAAHLPCGQASDSAHLDNEKLRMLNLVKAREILGSVFAAL